MHNASRLKHFESTLIYWPPARSAVIQKEDDDGLVGVTIGKELMKVPYITGSCYERGNHRSDPLLVMLL